MVYADNTANDSPDPKRIVYSWITTYTFDPTCTRIVAVSPEVRVAETVEEREAASERSPGSAVVTYTYDFPGPYRKPGDGPR